MRWLAAIVKLNIHNKGFNMAGFLTNSGLAKLAVATPLTPMTVKYMAFDAGQGTATPTMTALFNEVYRTEIPNPVKDTSTPKNLTFSGFVPTTVGGWTVYGVGLFDSLNVLVAYLQLAEPVTKSDPSSPLKMSWQQDFIITLANAGETDLIITDSIEFRHDALTNRNHPDAHNIASITGLQDNLAAKDTALTDHITAANLKDAQNVKLTGDQTIDGYKSFNGNIGVETINNGNATISLENDSAGISAGTGPNFTGISIDASGKTITVTGQLTGDGSGLDEATAAKRGNVQLATSAEIATGTNAVKAITPKALRDSTSATLAQIGSHILPSGLIEKWGYVARGAININTEVTLTFAAAFPNNCFNIQVTMKDSAPGSGSDAQVHILTISKTAATYHYQLYNQDAGIATLEGFYWRAIGN